MSTGTQSKPTLDNSQREWLKKMGAALGVKVADVTSTPPGAGAAAGPAQGTPIKELAAKADGLMLKVDPDKANYEKSLKTHEPTFTKANSTAFANHPALKALATAYLQAKKALEDLVAAGKYKEASAKLPDVSAKAKAYIDGRKGYDDFNTENIKVSADIGFVVELMLNTPVDSSFKAETKLAGQIMTNFTEGKFGQALKDMKALQPKVADLRKRVAEHDKKAVPLADAAEKEVQKLAGGKTVKGLSDADKTKLIEELKKLGHVKQREILEKLHAPSTELSDEQRQIQIVLYKAMELDPKFKEADKKVRDKYQAELQKDTALQSAVKDWNAKKDGKPVVDVKTKLQMLKKILAVQCKAYGIPVPELVLITDQNLIKAGVAGAFDSATGRMMLNPDIIDNRMEVINTIIHENTHNFQNELVKRFVAGKIPKTDPMYEQAKTFATVKHKDAYIGLIPKPGSTTGELIPEDFDAYKRQPSEMQAWEAGADEAKKLIDASTKSGKP